MTKNNHIGNLVISIDFELNWGVLDMKNIAKYESNILNGRDSLLKTIELFKEYNIHCTVATVGLLFNKTKAEILESVPSEVPSYIFLNASPYSSQINHIGNNETEDKIHYGNSIIEELKKHPNIEIASHTYSHYYTLDHGHDLTSFEADMDLYATKSSENNCPPSSIVFPRNQVNTDYLQSVLKKGIFSYRGNEKSWMYRSGNTQQTTYFTRMIRIADAYFNLSGNNTFPIPQYDGAAMMNIPSSRFFRPVRVNPSNFGSKFFSKLKLRRIKKSMTHAAKKGEVFHLWWHPHNFGRHENQMFAELNEVLEHFSDLQEEYGMQSRTMNELFKVAKNGA